MRAYDSPSQKKKVVACAFIRARNKLPQSMSLRKTPTRTSFLRTDPRPSDIKFTTILVSGKRKVAETCVSTPNDRTAISAHFDQRHPSFVGNLRKPMKTNKGMLQYPKQQPENRFLAFEAVKSKTHPGSSSDSLMFCSFEYEAPMPQKTRYDSLGIADPAGVSKT